MGQIGELLPGVLGALVVLLIGWFIARGVRKLTHRLVSRSGLDDRINRNGSKSVSAAAMISKLVYYVLLTVVPDGGIGNAGRLARYWIPSSRWLPNLWALSPIWLQL